VSWLPWFDSDSKAKVGGAALAVLLVVMMAVLGVDPVQVRALAVLEGTQETIET